MAFSARGTVIRTAAVVAIGAMAVFGLAGCKDTAKQSASPSNGGSTPSDSASPAPEATPSASQTPKRTPGTPIGVSCMDLIPPQTMYDFNPNFSLQLNYAPAAGTAASTALGYEGLACGWINQTSRAIISVGAAHPAASDLAVLRSAAGSGTAVSGLGDAAWFSTSGGIGQLQVFTGPFWITASSDYFGTADDARDLVKAAVAAIK